MPTTLSAPSRLWQLGMARPAGRLGALVDRPSAPAGGHYAGGDLYDWARRTVEKVRVASVGGRLRFLPWVDTYTEETPEIRQEYRVMLRESSIKAAFQTKVLSVISEEVNVSPDDDDDPREQEGADFCRYALRKLDGGTRQAGWSVLHPAIIDGHSVCEKVWRQRPLSRGKFKGKRIYDRLKAKDTRFLLLGIDSFRNLTALKGTGFNAGRVWSPSDFVVFSYFSLFENPAGMSDFRAAYRPYWVKHTAWQLRSLHLENFTGPFLVGRYGPVEQKAALEDAFNDARANTWLTIPTSAMVETIDLSMRGTGDFKDAIADCDREILIAIVGAHLQILEGQTGGARGNTKVHKEIGELIQWWLAATLADVYQQQLVVPLMEENYHDVEPPLVTVGAVTDEDVLQRAKVYESLQKLGLTLSKKAVYRSVNIQPPDPGDRDDVLEPPGQGGQGAPGLPGGGTGGGEGGGEGGSPFSEARRFCQQGPNKGKPGPCPEGKFDKESRRVARGTALKSADELRGEVKGMTFTPEQDAALNYLFGAGAGESLRALPERERLVHNHALHSVVSRMPAKAVARLTENVSRVRAVASHEDTTAEYLRRSFGEVNLGPNEAILGFYAPADGALWSDGASESGGGLETHRGVWSHEMGHGIDGPDFALSRSGEWKAAFAAEIEPGDLSAYATTAPEEGFAEFARAVYGSDVPHDRIESLFPRCMAYFRSQGLV